MQIQKFEDIIAWKKGQDLAYEIYQTFRSSKDFGFKDQIQRAAVSVSNNIAEGFDSMSDRKFVWYLYVSIASCSEVKSMLYLAQRLKYINDERTKILIELCNEIGRITRGLIKSLASKS